MGGGAATIKLLLGPMTKESVLRSRSREVVVLNRRGLENSRLGSGLSCFLAFLLSKKLLCVGCSWSFFMEFLLHKHTKISRCDVSFRTLRVAFPALKQALCCGSTVDVRTVM